MYIAIGLAGSTPPWLVVPPLSQLSVVVAPKNKV
jgi:hypothetical protein